VRRLRVGVIGAGSWAVASHLPELVRRADVELIIVNRRDPDRLERIRSQFGVPKASTRWEDVIDEHLDVVVVSSPAAVHHEQVRAALEVGAHVLCEKPFTISSTDAWDLVQLSDRVDRQIVIAFGWNYRPIAIAAERLLAADGGIGPVEHLAVYMASATRALLGGTGGYRDAAADVAPRSDTWTHPELSGGGYGQAQLSHALGLALGLTGLRATEAHAFMTAPGGGRVELHDAIAVRFEGGAIGTVSGASNHPGAGNGRHQLEIRAIAEAGQLLVDLERDVVWRHRIPDRDDRPQLPSGAGRYDCAGPIEAIVELARGRGVNRSSAELGARTVEILEAAYRSASSGKPELIHR